MKSFTISKVILMESLVCNGESLLYPRFVIPSEKLGLLGTKSLFLVPGSSLYSGLDARFCIRNMSIRRVAEIRQTLRNI